MDGGPPAIDCYIVSGSRTGAKFSKHAYYMRLLYCDVHETLKFTLDRDVKRFLFSWFPFLDQPDSHDY